MIYGELKYHRGHPEHKLELEHGDRPYRCDGCLEIGFGVRYKCGEPFSSCDFHLHKDCACHDDTITHPFYPGRVFHFLVSPDDPGRYCDACGRDIKGYNYHCFEEGLDLHPSCAALAETMVDGDVTLKLKCKLSSKCYKCGKKKLGGAKRKSWAYVSGCGGCHLHVACVKDMLVDNWEKECLGQRKAVLEEDVVEAEKAVANREPRLGIVLDKGTESKWGRLSKYKKIVKIALSFVMAAVVGDPTALVVGLITSLIVH